VGVDGGGTKTLALAATFDGQWQGRGAAGASNLHSVGFNAACAALEQAILAALDGAELAALCLGLAGAGRPEEAAQFAAWAQVKFPNSALKVTSDAEILLAAGAPVGPVLALICGTGSIAYGRTGRGELVRAGGWGYLFGDEGSGFAIGAAALRAVMQAYDGRGPETRLTGLILAQRGLDRVSDLVQNIYGNASPRAEIAGLAELVETAAAQADEVALTILTHAALELAEMTRVVQRQVGEGLLPLAVTGGVILRGAILAGAFRQACARLGVNCEILEVAEPARGALGLARALL
jgi:N-acetylglucosamine kinase-like BadF-type ATPase